MAANDETPRLEPRPLVHVVWPDGSFEQVGTFRTESEAHQWIDEKSDERLKTHVHRMPWLELVCRAIQKCKFKAF
jgi:hypothetical protein